MPKSRLRFNVMVSSTTIDLPVHRKAATDAIFRRGMFPLVMETGTAVSGNALDFSLDLVDDADVYVGVFGFRYGYIPVDNKRNPQERSITELEYRRALERKIPILLFVMAEDHPFTGNVSDHDKFYETNQENKEKLNRLKTELKTDYVVGFFKSPDELSGKVYQALDQLADTGKLTLSKADDEPSSKGNGLPAPPEPYIPHPYILTRKFFGREHELRILDEWAVSTDPMLIIEAIGGLGKSALTWEWFQRHCQEYEASFWWSFYESDAAVMTFFKHALAYLEGKPLDAYEGMLYEERERLLLRLLAEKRYLLVLDGIERILVAYHRLDAAQLTDEQVETEARGVNHRTCTDPKHGELLKKLAKISKKSKVLVSTRLTPSDLEDRAHKLIDEVHRHQLKGMLPDDALAYIQHLGVYGNKLELKNFMQQFGNHSLLIGIIAGKINDYYPAPGNFDEWYTDEGVRLRLSDLDLKQRRSHILHYAMANLKPELRQLLSQLAAFNYPLDYETLAAFNPYLPLYPAPQFHKKLYQEALTKYKNAMKITRPQFHATLHELEDRGLLQWDRGTDRYDLHPVVRGYAFDSVDDNERKNAFERIRDHFERQPEEDLDEVLELAQLQRSIQIYRALVGAGLLDQATEFYGQRLSGILLQQLAAYHTIVQLLTPLFGNGVDQLPTLTDPAQQSACTTDMANAFNQLGQNEQSLRLQGLQLKLNLDRKNALSLGVSLWNYANSVGSLNRLALSLHVRELKRKLTEAANDKHGLATAYLLLLASYADIGDWQAAEAAYQAFKVAPPLYQMQFWQADAERYYVEILIYRGIDASETLSQAETLAKASRHALAQRALLCCRGEVALREEQAEQATEYFIEAIRLHRQAGSGDLIIPMGGLARAHAMQGRQDDARHILQQAFEIAEHNRDFRDLNNNATEVYLMLGEKEKARQHAIAAYKVAWADGPPYVFWWHLERAKKVLDALGEPYPDLPPFDPAKVEKIPYEDEIRAFIEELKTEKPKKGKKRR